VAKLSDLKTLLADAQKDKSGASAVAPTRTRAARRPERRDDEASDVNLAQAFADVAPLPSANRVRHVKPKPSAIPVQSAADEAAALAASKYGAQPSPAAWEIGQEIEGNQTFVRAGLGNDVLTKLRRGHWVVQGEIDLHRLTVTEAREALAEFLDGSRTRGWRCVRVIHGKGISSPNREPVLKGNVRRWLSHWDGVLAYSEAQRHAGGSGAVVVLLKSPSTRTA
jgi:DNA-nicking Smr family endonuclease